MVPTVPQVVSAARGGGRCYLGDTMARTTTLKLSDNLRKRIVPLAKASNLTAHAWMLEALDAQATLAERRRDFVGSAMASVDEGGRTYASEDVHTYFIAAASGAVVRRPRPRGRRTSR